MTNPALPKVANIARCLGHKVAKLTRPSERIERRGVTITGLPMTSPSSWYAAAHNWRMRAAETRALADEMKEAEPKAIMLRIAASERNVAEQRHRVRLIERNGGDVSLSRSILKNLEDSLRLHHEHRDLLVAGDTGLQRDQKEVSRPIANSASFAEILDVLVRTAMQQTEGDARAAFYIADAGGAALYHVIGMPQAYAKHVDGFPIGPQSLACGLAAATGRPIITRDVIEEPRWKPWLWLAKEFDYRACWSFPVETSAGKMLGSFAMYYKEPREATQRDLDLAQTLTRAASLIMN